MRRALALVALALVLASPAYAGGSFVDLARQGNHLWFVGEFGVREVDARNGRILAAPRLNGAAYPTSVAVAGGAAWVASVQNGYTAGELTRIDLRTGRQRVVMHAVVEYVAAGAGGIYALLGDGRLALVRPNGRVARTWNVPYAGRLAADASGCWISRGDGTLLHVDARGVLHRVLRARMGDVATGGGAVWLPLARSLLRIDERTGGARTFRTSALRLGGFQHDLAVGDGGLWLLQQDTRYRSFLVRRSLVTGRIDGVAPLPGIADAVVPTADGVWVGVAPSTLLRFDPRTLRRTATVDVG